MDGAFVYRLTAAFNPSLLLGDRGHAVPLDHPKQLLLGHLAGALLTSIALGLVIVYRRSTSSASTAQHKLSPGLDLTSEGSCWYGLVIRPGRRLNRRTGWPNGATDGRRRRRARGRPRWQQTLSKGSARTTFVVGALLYPPWRLFT